LLSGIAISALSQSSPVKLFRSRAGARAAALYREEQGVPCEVTVLSDGLLQRLVKAAEGFRRQPRQQGRA